MFFLFDAINDHKQCGQPPRCLSRPLSLDSKHGRSANPCHQEARNLHLAVSLCLNAGQSAPSVSATLGVAIPVCDSLSRTGYGGYAIDGVNYPVCTIGANSCLNKIIHRRANPCDIIGAALRCILKGMVLSSQDDVCANIGAFLQP